jgi:hypothetical protein
LPVQPQRQGSGQTSTILESRRSHNLDAWYLSNCSKIGTVVTIPGKQNRRKFAWAKPAERRKQITLIVIATSPKLTRNVRECKAQRHAPYHRA